MGLPNGQWTMTPSILPKLWQNGLRTTKSRYWSGPDLNPIENLWAELKKCVGARRPTNLTQLHQLCQEEWAEIHPTYCGKLVEGYPKHLTQVKQFKGNASKY
uniref:Tc1-like transposase DDE domain-containing protein n=1 Tax=Oncorhynchus tshawytscha TaxID=74940 RepID=A0AAZ3PS99_ONCTS